MNKVIFLSDKRFEYKYIRDLSDELIKRNIYIGDGCILGDRCKLRNRCELEYGCELGNECELGYMCKLGDRCILGDKCILGNECILKDGCELGNGCELRDRCILGNGCILGNWCKLGYRCILGNWYVLGSGCELKNTPFYALGLYKYHVAAHYNEGTAYVQLGCFLRTKKEWDENFWNNEEEFKQGTQKGKKREFAYKIACIWLDKYKQQNT
jgi:carbonic anhydrase/acetyltransferase-like protein (isoleucine patch superfamily)